MVNRRNFPYGICPSSQTAQLIQGLFGEGAERQQHGPRSGRSDLLTQQRVRHSEDNTKEYT